MPAGFRIIQTLRIWKRIFHWFSGPVICWHHNLCISRSNALIWRRALTELSLPLYSTFTVKTIELGLPLLNFLQVVRVWHDHAQRLLVQVDFLFFRWTFLENPYGKDLVESEGSSTMKQNECWARWSLFQPFGRLENFWGTRALAVVLTR